MIPDQRVAIGVCAPSRLTSPSSSPWTLAVVTVW
jgi:hypothetical protein